MSTNITLTDSMLLPHRVTAFRESRPDCPEGVTAHPGPQKPERRRRIRYCLPERRARMSMNVRVSVNGTDITSLQITNLTEKPSGVNRYRWIYSRHDLGDVNGLLSAQAGYVEHTFEDGAMALIAKVAQAASETEVSA